MDGCGKNSNYMNWLNKAQDSKKDTETNTCSITIPDNSMSQNSNLPAELKLCAGARVMLTENINVLQYQSGQLST